MQGTDDKDEAVKKIRFGDFIRETQVQSTSISYSHLMPKPKYDKNGNEIPNPPQKLKLRPVDTYRLLAPFFSSRFFEQARAVVPLAIYLGLFQWLVLKQSVQNASIIGAGLFAVMIGLMLFMEGLKLGLMPFGEVIGNTLPKKKTLPVVLGIAFALGVGVTFAEPAIGALQVAGSIVDPNKAPYLYTLLNDRAWATVLVVGLGVGSAAVLGTMRFIYGWSLKPMIYLSLIPTILITIVAQFSPELSKVIGLAWDCGAVTTGPVTVPLVLALGIGVSSSVGKGDSALSGFGIVTMASIFPILGVLLLATFVSFTVTPEEIISMAMAQKTASAAAGGQSWHETTPGVEIVMGVRAIVPLILFLVFVLKVVLKEKMANAKIVRYGLALSLIGMVVFNLGLTYGLSMLGDQAGGLVPAAFAEISGIENSPLYGASLGIFIAALFAWFLGFGATLAEPALNALGITVENLTSGAFKKSMLMYAVSFGVACGLALGVSKIIFDFPVAYALVPLYAIGLILTRFSSEEYVNVGWDSAGVTTGPVTVPLVLAMGLGFGKALGVTEGFGILAGASICPIISVLSMGLYVEWKSKRQAEIEDRSEIQIEKSKEKENELEVA